MIKEILAVIGVSFLTLAFFIFLLQLVEIIFNPKKQDTNDVETNATSIEKSNGQEPTKK